MKFILIALFVGGCLTRISWPDADDFIKLSSPIIVGAWEIYDGFKENNNKWVSFQRKTTEFSNCFDILGSRKDAVFILRKGATLKNVIIHDNSVGNVYCIEDGCTIENVYWRYLCGIAITFEGARSPAGKYYVKGGGVRFGKNKVIQHNSSGIVYISNFYVEFTETLYSSCGNCKLGYQGKRSAVLENVTVYNSKTIAELNSNYGDTITLKNVDNNVAYHVCRVLEGRNDGKEPTVLGYKCEKSGRIKSCTCR